MKNKTLIIGAIILSMLSSNAMAKVKRAEYGPREEKSTGGPTLHVKTDSLLGLSPCIGYKFGKVELMYNYNEIKGVTTRDGEYQRTTAYAPTYGLKIYVVENADKRLSAYIGGEKGQGEILMKVSDDDYQDYLEDTKRDRGTIDIYSVYIGAEYYLTEAGSFSISSEIGVRGIALDMAETRTELSSSFGSVGINYYF